MRFAMLLMSLLVSVHASAETFNELLDSEDTPGYTMTDRGVVAERDIAERTIIVGGYRYKVGTSFETPVTLFGTSAGAYELLDTGMKVEVEYFDLQDKGRVAIRINELHPGEEVEF